MWGFCVGFCLAMHYFVFSSFATILMRKEELVALLLVYFGCLNAINVQWLFLTVPWVGFQFVILVFLDHTHLLGIMEPP